jgi:regulator of cell morphogenesis and NO signaling
MNYIVQKHHKYCRQVIAAIEPLLTEVLRNHGEKHPELKRVKSLFAKFSSELLMHLVKEEATLFPYIARLEEAVGRKEAFPRPAYGTVANPVRMMMMEHDVSSTDFKGTRQASNNYGSPPDASPNYKAVYQALKELEQDLRVHSDLEDKVLFPRAVALEGVAESIAGGAKVSPP